MNAKQQKNLDAIREKLLEGKVVDAGELVIKRCLRKRMSGTLKVDEAVATDLLQKLTRSILNEGNYLAAARLLWPDRIFTIEPESVRRIWQELPSQSELIVIGAASCGKSYVPGVWLLLDWLRDPLWTAIKVLSVTKEHAKRNVFAHIKNLYANAMFKLPGRAESGFIQANDDDTQGIHLVAIPTGEDGKGRLRGFHPKPRLEAHPIFGNISRVRVVMDEAEEIPGGVWEDVDNILITKSGVEHVKVFAATNPKDRTSKLGIRCEPPNGWSSVDIEKDLEWTSRLNWKVIRIDGARCENVVQRKIVFEGLLTHEGFQRYLDLGDTSPEYATMARGWFPDASNVTMSVMSDSVIDRAAGNVLFHGPVTYCAAVDPALDGGDRIVMTVGRFGHANGYHTLNGRAVMFEKPHGCLEVQNQFDLPPGRTIEVARSIVGVCKRLHVPAVWLALDSTGTCAGVYDVVQSLMGGKVMGVDYSRAPTSAQVMDDDSRKANDLYSDLPTELWFSCRKWLEFGYMFFGPAMKVSGDLRHELTGRRYKQSGKSTLKIESKREYKVRNQKSPDHADSLTILCHLVRMHSGIATAMLETAPRGDPGEAVMKTSPTSATDDLEFLSFA